MAHERLVTRGKLGRRRVALLLAVLLAVMLPGVSPAIGAPSEQKLVAIGGVAGDTLGNPVAVSQNWLAAGILSGATGYEGSVYVFKPDGAGGWTDAARIVPADIAVGDWFGRSIAIVGNRIVVGSPNDDDAGHDSGSVYVFEPDGGGGWSQVAKLTASDAQINAHFGDVAATGNRIVVGAPQHGDIGKVYVFHQDPVHGWVETETMVPPGEFFHHDFGRTVATLGDRIAVGAPSFAFANDPAAVYVFESDGFGGWPLAATLQASDGAENCFGVELAMITDVIAVGDPCGSDPEAAYVYQRTSGGTWNETRLAPPPASPLGFGEGIALSPGRLIVGATGRFDTVGAAHVYAPDGSGGWAQVAKLSASDEAPGHSFGASIAILGDSVFVGAPHDDSSRGAVYVYDLGPDRPACTLRGTPGDDVLTGTSRDDVICGLGGNDTIYGKGGDDILRGGSGRDRLFGGPGGDQISGGGGNDTIWGNAGDDVLVGGPGADRIHPGRDVDVVNGGTGLQDWVVYSSAVRRMVVSLRTGVATGQGRDTLVNVENIVGSKFNDRLIGDASSNRIMGGSGADRVVARQGDDRMWGQRGPDVLLGGLGADVARGGSGADTCTAEVQFSC